MGSLCTAYIAKGFIFNYGVDESERLKYMQEEEYMTIYDVLELFSENGIGYANVGYCDSDTYIILIENSVLYFEYYEKAVNIDKCINYIPTSEELEALHSAAELLGANFECETYMFTCYG